MRHLMAIIAGVLFAAGLVVSGMTNSTTVIGFLDITHNWQPDLLFVMIGAIGVHSVSYVIKKSMARPLLENNWHIPQSKIVDKPLVFGAILFGIGWGIAGVCPGPSLVAATSTHTAPTLVFFASMLFGMFLFKIFNNKIRIK